MGNTLWAADLVNENGISAIAIAFFTALFAMVGTVSVQLIKSRQSVNELKATVGQAADKADTAAEKAATAAENTIPVSNGFAQRMDRKLDLLARNQDRLEEMFTEHLSWHLNQDSQKKERNQ